MQQTLRRGSGPHSEVDAERLGLLRVRRLFRAESGALLGDHTTLDCRPSLLHFAPGGPSGPEGPHRVGFVSSFAKLLVPVPEEPSGPAGPPRTLRTHPGRRAFPGPEQRVPRGPQGQKGPSGSRPRVHVGPPGLSSSGLERPCPWQVLVHALSFLLGPPGPKGPFRDL